jgi:hypothetical protein
MIPVKPMSPFEADGNLLAPTKVRNLASFPHPILSDIKFPILADPDPNNTGEELTDVLCTRKKTHQIRAWY